MPFELISLDRWDVSSPAKVDDRGEIGNCARLPCLRRSLGPSVRSKSVTPNRTVRISYLEICASSSSPSLYLSLSNLRSTRRVESLNLLLSLIPKEKKEKMDEIMNKFGSYWFSQRANKEISSVGDDFSSMSNSIESGSKWLVNKIKGKMQKPLPDLLREYDLPAGIFPKDATNYELDEQTGKLTIFIPSMCEVGYRDSSVLRFFTTVTGYLEKGKLVDIDGVKTKMIVWTKVTCISSEGTKVYFTAGLKKGRSKSAYEVLRNGILVDKF